MKSEIKNIKRYEDEYQQLDFESIQVKIRKKTEITQINKYKHSSILEIGCGLNPIYNSFNNFDNLTIVEPSDNFYNNALNNAPKNVMVQQGYFEEVANELTELRPDIILISSLLHEVDNEKTFLTALKKVITTKTIIHINVPNANSFHRLLAKEMGLIKDVHQFSEVNKTMQQKRVFDIKSLEKLLVKNDFKIIEQGTMFIKPFTHYQMKQLMDQNIIDHSILEGLNKMTHYFPENGSEIYIDVKLA